MWRWLHLIRFSLNIMWSGACGDDDLALGQVLRLDVAQRASEASAHLPGQRNHGEKLYGEELQVCILKSCQKQKKQNSLPFLFQWDRTCWCAPHEERTTGPAAGIVLGSHLKKSFTILSARAWRQWTQAPATPWQTWSLALWRNLQHNQRARWYSRWTDNSKSLLLWCQPFFRKWPLTTHCWPDLAPLINGWRDLNIHSLNTSSTSWNTHNIYNIC